MRKEFTPDKDQITALRWFADLHGRGWKLKLQNHWLDGTNPSTNADYNANLRAIRNAGGCVWLKTFRFSK